MYVTNHPFHSSVWSRPSKVKSCMGLIVTYPYKKNITMINIKVSREYALVECSKIQWYSQIYVSPIIKLILNTSLVKFSKQSMDPRNGFDNSFACSLAASTWRTSLGDDDFAVNLLSTQNTRQSKALTPNNSTISSVVTAGGATVLSILERVIVWASLPGYRNADTAVCCSLTAFKT